MTLRRAARVDQNQAEIVAALRKVGCSVALIKLPVDALVARKGQMWLMDFKSRQGRPTGLQTAFCATWPTPVYFVKTVEEALHIVGGVMTIQELQSNIGVSEDIARQMIALDATVIVDDGLLLRTCGCGVRHPVGHVARDFRQMLRYEAESVARRHERRGDIWALHSQCCEQACCAAWNAPADAVPVSAVFDRKA